MFTLKLLGGLSIVEEQGPLSGRAFQKRRLALLSLLSMAPTGALSRDKLVAYLWPESEPEQGRHLLSVSVYELRKALGDDAILTVGDDLRLNPETVWSDAQAFEQAVARGELENAIGLYGGPFLDGFFISGAAEFERWTADERERLAHTYATALEQLANRRESDHDLRGAVEAWRRLAAHDRYDSHVALRLMQALDAAGDRVGALQHARVHAVLLQEEYGVEPDPAILALADRLRHEPSAGEPAAATTDHPTPAAAAGATQQEPEPPTLSSRDSPDAGALRPGSFPAPAADSSRRDSAGTAVANGRARWRPALLLVGVFALLLAGSLAIWWARRPTSPTATSILTIAVLPFVDTSPDADNEYLADGLTDELINTLAQVERLRVAARTSSFAYKGTSTPVRRIGEELGVGVVLEGSIRQAGNHLRVHAQLVNTEDGYNLWARSYDRAPQDIFTVEEDIVRAVVQQLQAEPTQRTADLVRGRTANLEAYHHYLRGRYFWYRRDEPQRREENLRRSLDYFQLALAAQPGYALAYAGLADSYASLAGRIPADEAYSRAKAAALRAIEYDETVAEGHVALARILVFREWDWAGAGRAYRRAIELSPSYATARQWHGMYLLHLGRREEALEEIRLAQRLDPLSISVNADVGRVLYNIRRYDEAISQWRSILELNPNSTDARLYLGLTYVEQGRFDEARLEFERLEELTRESSTSLLAYMHAAAGNRAEAERLLRVLLAETQQTRAPTAGVALVYARLGDRDNAFRWLQQAADERSAFLLFLKVSPRVDPLRGDPRYRQLLRRIGLDG